MKLMKLLFILSLLFAVGCSNSKRKKNAEETAKTEEVQEDADFIVDADDDELLVDDSEAVEIAEVSDANIEEVVEDHIASEPVAQSAGQVANYTVQKNETLMMVAFKLYGDYRKWKEIRDFNGLNSGSVAEGSVIRYKTPESVFQWSPEGMPYLIKRGDTLATISQDKYNTPNKWRSIYDNNRPLIRDPNLIFAGFTLYYLPLRDIASE